MEFSKLISLLVLGALTVLEPNSYEEKELLRKDRPNPLSSDFIPPGSTPVTINGETRFIDRTEITNNDWAQYLQNLKAEYGKNDERYISALPDSSIWNSTYDGDVRKFSGSSGGYPVVGITYKQAKKFANWRSQAVNNRLRKIDKNEIKVDYKIPSVKELESVKKIKKCNSNNKDHYSYENKQREKGGKEVYGLCDNVSEFTSTKDSTLGESQVFDGRNSFSKDPGPSRKIGFRCITMIKKSN